MNPTETSSLSQFAPASTIETEISFDSAASPNPDDSAESRDWSCLPDSLRSLPRQMSSLKDLYSFRAVCRFWRSLPDAALPPLLLLSLDPSSSESFYDILRRRLYSTRLPWPPPSHRSLAFSHGFLITVSDPDASGRYELLLWKPLSGACIRCLPKSIRSLHRVILSSSPASSSPACSVVCFWPCSKFLQFCSLGDDSWIFYTFSNAIYDMIFFCGQLYALTRGCCLATVNLTHGPEFTLLGSRIDPKSDGPGNKNCWKWMLAESGGNLLLVGIYGASKGFNVFRWDFKGGGGWLELLDLDGRALFLELNGFAASVVPNCSAVKGNCIYYADHRESVYYEFSLKDQSLKTISLNLSCSLQSDAPKIWVFLS